MALLALPLGPTYPHGYPAAQPGGFETTARQHLERTTFMVTIVPIDTPTLGDRSYLAHDGQVALVVDPQRDIDRVLRPARRSAGVRITHVFETHIHNDYVTGGWRSAQATGAAYHVNAADEVSYDRVPVGRRRRRRGQSRAAGHACWPRPATRSPTCPTRSTTRPTGKPVGGVLRRVAAVRRDRPPGPARPRPHPRPGAPPVRLGAPARRPSCPTRTQVLPDPRVRRVLLGRPSPRRRPRPSGRRSAPTRP